MLLRLLPAAALGVVGPIMVGDSQNYGQGSYSAYASPWSTFFDHGLVRGRDYLDTITIDPARFPDGTVIDTRWPVAKPAKGVWGYHSVAYGNYDGNRPPVPISSRQVKNIRHLSEIFAFRYAGSPYFNLLNEFYLTSRAGDAAAKVIEIGIFLHAPETTQRFVHSGRPITTFNDTAGRDWLVTQSGSYVTIMRADDRDLARGQLDLRQILALLSRHGVITGNEWFNGLAFGTEPTEGAGRTKLTIAHWRMDYD